MDKNKLFKIIEFLDGSCRDLEEACEVFDVNEDDLTKEDHEIIDEHIQCCDSCGWWTNTTDLVETPDGELCDECAEDCE